MTPYGYVLPLNAVKDGLDDDICGDLAVGSESVPIEYRLATFA